MNRQHLECIPEIGTSAANSHYGQQHQLQKQPGCKAANLSNRHKAKTCSPRADHVGDSSCYTRDAMNRWLTILLLVLLPLQLSWAAGSVYCQHETGCTVQHFGHHEHQHQADAGDVNNSSPTANGAIDADCGTCHAGFATPIFESVSLSMVSLSSDRHNGHQFRLSSHPPSLPERPNWADLA